MADTPVLPQFPAVNAPAHIVAALTELAECLRSAVEIERDYPSDSAEFETRLNEHAECYENLHGVLDNLASHAPDDAVTRFTADMSQQMSNFMLCEDAAHQAWLYTFLTGFLARAVKNEACGFADPRLKHQLSLIQHRFAEFAPFHDVETPSPSRLRDGDGDWHHEMV